MQFDVVSLFPEMFAALTQSGVTRRAHEQGLWNLSIWNPRDFTTDRHRTVDDRPYGGGPGMVMLAEPLLRALDTVRAARAEASPAPVVLFTPTGRPLDQAAVRGMAEGPGAVFVCGRYEGIDQRFIDSRVDIELSLGDFVLSGGELPALVLLDAIARLQGGVLGDAQSPLQDSFSDGLLEGPHYTRPEVLQAAGGALPVPAVLLSGHHAEIARWRRERSLALTFERRPELIAAARAAGRLSAADERYLATLSL
jgi:tRNA (guanine37-N1)-methyltransferase